MFSNREGPDQLHAGALLTQAWQQIVGCRHAVRQQGVTPIPLLRFDLIEGRSESDVRKIRDITHDVLIETLQVPKRDRYQVVHEHKRKTPVWDLSGRTTCSCFKSQAAREAAR